MISKGAAEVERFRRGFEGTEAAREAIYRFVSRISLGRRPRVLVPAYYGWSSREGSGVIDPLQRAGAAVELIRVNRQLHVDMDHLRELLRRFAPDVVMPIHFFGWHDPELPDLLSECRAAGTLVLEDEAHSALSCLLGLRQTAAGDASAVSLHKALPLSSGGALIDRRDYRLQQPAVLGPEDCAVLEYDLAAIALRRKKLAVRIMDEIRQLCPGIRLLRSTVPEDVVPLNVPVIVPPRRRQKIYSEMNSRGFGVVSLYHTLGPGICADEHPDSFWLSERLVNLPCHQDVEESQVPPMVEALSAILAE